MTDTPWSERDHFGEFERAMDELDQTLAVARETAPQFVTALGRVMVVPFLTLTAEQRDRLQDVLAPFAILFQQISDAFAKWEVEQPPPSMKEKEA